MGWRDRMQRARKLHRPSLKDWEADGLYDSFFSEFASELLENRARDYESFPEDRGIPAVLHCCGLSKETFWKEYEAKEVPCVIQGLAHQQQQPPNNQQPPPWPAVERWNFECLRNNDDLRDRWFKCGEDDDGKAVKVKLKHFLRYVRSNQDDSPLYIFDSGFDDDRSASRLLDDYRVPEYFSQDLFGLISESRRPPYRWFLVGPERSGTTIHIDPLATNAWNTLLHGTKRWVLFPPHVPKHIVKAKGLIRSDEDDEAIHYFWFLLPRIKRQAAAALQLQQRNNNSNNNNTKNNHHHHHSKASSFSNSDYDGFQCYEFTQHAGETVFVPNGWWHAVLNLTDTIGVTQNFCSPRNFPKVWRKTRTGRPRMAWKLLQQLQHLGQQQQQQQQQRYGSAGVGGMDGIDYRKCAQIALQINAEDGFVMKYDPVEQQRRERVRMHQRQQHMLAARRQHMQQQQQQQQSTLDSKPRRPADKPPDTSNHNNNSNNNKSTTREEKKEHEEDSSSSDDDDEDKQEQKQHDKDEDDSSSCSSNSNHHRHHNEAAETNPERNLAEQQQYPSREKRRKQRRRM